MLLSSSAIRRSLPRLLVVLTLVATAVEAQVPAPLPMPKLALAQSGEVSSIAYQPDGGLVLVGTFTSIDGVPRDGLARLRPDGSLDPLWYPRVRWTDMSPTFVVRRVYALADGSVIVTGDVGHVDGQPTLGCGFKLSAAPSPVADLSWHLNAGGCSTREFAFDDQGWYYLIGLNAVRRGRVDTGVLDPDWYAPTFSGGKLIYDGNGGLLQQSTGSLTRFLTSTGAVDTAWQQPGVTWDAAIAGAADVASGFVYVGYASGTLAKYALATGQSAPGWPKQVYSLNDIALNADGDIYAGGSWRVEKLSGATGERLGVWTLEGVERRVVALARHGDGSVVAAGNFARIGDVSTFSLARWVPSIAQPVPMAQAERAGYAEHLALQPDGGIVVAGTFDRADGVDRLRMLRLLPDGTLDPDWAPRVDDWIRMLAADSSGDIYIGGNFDRVDEHEPENGLAKIDGDSGDAVANWNPWFSGTAPWGIVVDAADRVYVITSDVSSQLAYRLLADGSIDSAWTPSGMSGRGTGLTRVGDDLYMGLIDPATDIQSVRRVSIATAVVDTQWQLTGVSFYAGLSIVRADDGDLLFGGWFADVNGAPRNYLARVSSTAPVQVRAWNPSPNGPVYGLRRADDGRVFVSGSFTMIGGKPRNGIAELAPSDGEVLDSWVPPLGGARMLLTEDRIYLTSGQRGVIAYPLDIGDTIFATRFD